MTRVFAAIALGFGTLLMTGSLPADAGAANTCVWRGGGRPKCVARSAQCKVDETRKKVRQRLGSCPQVFCCKKSRT